MKPEQNKFELPILCINESSIHTIGKVVKRFDDDGSSSMTIGYCSLCKKAIEVKKDNKRLDPRIIYSPNTQEEFKNCTNHSIPHIKVTYQETIMPAKCLQYKIVKEIVYCSVCGKELRSKVSQGGRVNHIASKPVIENEILGNCTKNGSYYEVVYCSICKKELSRTKYNTPNRHELLSCKENIIQPEVLY